ncbi:MAG: DUF1549 domain-containing protein, partial [Pirellulales bacterium]|nr:DUF1549 domain-containing protein [Pirellulales bacterium]
MTINHIRKSIRRGAAKPLCRDLAALIGLVCVSVTSALSAEPIDYLRDIKPVLKAKCYSCHGALKQESSLRLDTAELARTGGDSGPAVDPGNADQSLLLERVTETDSSLRMPPEGEPLTSEQVERFRRWIQAGAEGPAEEVVPGDPGSHWAFQPLQDTAPPNLPGHPVDRFIRHRLRTAGFAPAPPAQPVALIRRIFLDLHGLPPTPAQMAHWRPRIEQDRTQVTALVDRLLASPRYGERWAQHWLDVVRYADTHGYEVNTPRPNAWPYRDYVIDAFNSDKPYDRFVTEQLVGDAMGQDAATGFMVAAATLLPGQIGKDDASKRLARQDALDEIIVGTSATFLAMTIGCARCHDHKFDPVTQQDYYAMQAFFSGVEYGD